MFYESGKQFKKDIAKRLCLIGMSGIGKTMISNILRKDDWYHYSVDYRIGSEYMKKSIDSELRKRVMQVDGFDRLLRSDSIKVESKMGIDNLSALTNYLGQPGDPVKGGIPLEVYRERLLQHESAERKATVDYSEFMADSKNIYRYDHFVCDSSGSFCHLVDSNDSKDSLLNELASRCTIIHIESTHDQRENLIQTFRNNPKPIFYPDNLLKKFWDEYCQINNVITNDVDPSEFAIWGYSKIIEMRRRIYDGIGKKWGYTVQSSDMQLVKSGDDFIELIASNIDNLPERDSVVALYRNIDTGISDHDHKEGK